MIIFEVIQQYRLLLSLLFFFCVSSSTAVALLTRLLTCVYSIQQQTCRHLVEGVLYGASARSDRSVEQRELKMLMVIPRKK